jgi:hypothetical protein
MYDQNIPKQEIRATLATLGFLQQVMFVNRTFDLKSAREDEIETPCSG